MAVAGDTLLSAPFSVCDEAAVVVAQLVTRATLQLQLLAVVAGAVGQQLCILRSLNRLCKRPSCNLNPTILPVNTGARQAIWPCRIPACRGEPVEQVGAIGTGFSLDPSSAPPLKCPPPAAHLPGILLYQPHRLLLY